MTSAIKTWQERMQEFYGRNAPGFKPDNYMQAEIADLRAALTITTEELEEWRFTNKIDELQREVERLRGAMASASATRDAILEEAAIEAERQDRAGREWVRDSVWDNIIKRVPAAIRALKEIQ